MRTRTRRPGTAGLTLIEMLVALALCGVVLVPAAALMLQSYANEASYRQQNSAQQNARSAADIASDDLRSAVKNSIMVSPPTNPTQAAPLSFSIYDSQEPPVAKTVTYWRDTTNNNLYRQLNGGNAVVVARNITAFSVTYPNPVNFSITATTGTSPSQSIVTINARATMRNYLLR